MASDKSLSQRSLDEKEKKGFKFRWKRAKEKNKELSRSARSKKSKWSRSAKSKKAKLSRRAKAGKTKMSRKMKKSKKSKGSSSKTIPSKKEPNQETNELNSKSPETLSGSSRDSASKKGKLSMFSFTRKKANRSSSDRGDPKGVRCVEPIAQMREQTNQPHMQYYFSDRAASAYYPPRLAALIA
ncbi:hypothetical protein OSTOST_10294 [Ostertagia ostertagi]